jgi:hypothetical protein
MTTTVKCGVILTLLCVVSPTYAGSCTLSAARLQAKVEAAIEKRAGKASSKPESLDATLNYQPNPFSLAATEDYRGRDLEKALDSLDRARDAARVGVVVVCRRALASARAILRHEQH